jgi:multidrug resistance efflux pump
VQAAAENGNGRGRDAGKLEEALAALRSREAQLQAQERRLSEREATIGRREADLELYARKLQKGAVTSISVTPDEDAEPPVAAAVSESADDAGESSGAARRLNFWSR